MGDALLKNPSRRKRKENKNVLSLLPFCDNDLNGVGNWQGKKRAWFLNESRLRSRGLGQRFGLFDHLGGYFINYSMYFIIWGTNLLFLRWSLLCIWGFCYLLMVILSFISGILLLWGYAVIYLEHFNFSVFYNLFGVFKIFYNSNF